MIDPDEATELLTTVLPRSRPRPPAPACSRPTPKFAYIKREITPRQQQAVHRLGIPGIGFRVENRRFYPGGADRRRTCSARVNIDNQGIAGIEKYIDDAFLNDLHAAGFATGHALEPVQLSIDLRVQHVVRDELAKAMEKLPGHRRRSAS